MKRLYLTFYLFLIIPCAFSQAPSDLATLLQADFKIKEFEATRKVNYVFKGRNAFVKYNPLSLLFGGSLYFYQKVISPQIMAGCAFDVSCSAFSGQCMRRYGVLKGVALSADRLTRCTRLSAAGFHPVMINEDGKCIDHAEFYKLGK